MYCQTSRLVFKKIRAILGGHIRVVLSGGAPLAPDIHHTLKAALCCPILQGYGSFLWFSVLFQEERSHFKVSLLGLTEVCGAITGMDLRDLSVGMWWNYTSLRILFNCCCKKTTEIIFKGTVGGPLSGCDIKLVSWEEGNYRITDKPNPRGEIHVGGETVAAGYYKNPEQTKREFYEENGVRWFRTGNISYFLNTLEEKFGITKIHFYIIGDIGEITEIGTLKVLLIENVLLL